MYIKTLIVGLLMCCIQSLSAQSNQTDTVYLLKPDRVFDGEQIHDGWQVAVRHHKIEAVGNINSNYNDAITIDLKGCTLLPKHFAGRLYNRS